MGIENTGEGALLVTNGVGELVIAYLVRNQPVEELYGDMAHPITKKLVLAILAEKLTAQGADWREGYRWMTAFLRENQLLKPDKLPAMGMATVHETEMTPENEGKPRGPMAYGAASSWIPTVMTTLLLMNLPSFREHYEASMKSGVLEIDWLAGFMDFTVARAAAELVVGRDLSTNFPNPIQTEGWFGLSHYQINAN